MLITIEAVARLEGQLIREGRELDSQLQVPRVETMEEWADSFSGRVDPNAIAALCHCALDDCSGVAGLLAFGTLNFVRRTLDENPDLATFVLEYSLRRLRVLRDEAPVWRGVGLSETARLDAVALFDAARGDTTYVEGELIKAALSFAEEHAESGKIFGGLASGLRLLVATLRDEKAQKEHREVARAALVYFSEVADAIPDHLGPVGLLDDATVVQRALAEIYPERRQLKTLLDDVARSWPFVLDLAFGSEGESYAPSEFLLVNAALLLQEVLDVGCMGSVLVMSRPGLLPFLVALVRALAEVQEKLDREVIPQFSRGERLVSRQGGGEVEFSGYRRCEGEMLPGAACSPSEATHFELVERSRNGAIVKHWRRIEDIVSLQRAAKSTGDPRSGRVVLDADAVPLGAIERIFGLSAPAVIKEDRGQVLLVGPVGWSKELAQRLTVFGTPVLDIIPMGQERLVNDRFERSVWTKRGPGGHPVLLVVPTTAEALERVEGGGQAVVAVVAPIAADTTDALNLKRIAETGCRVLAIAGEADRESRKLLDGAGFRFWTWNPSWLSSLEWPPPSSNSGALPICDFENRVRQEGRARTVLTCLDLPGIEAAVESAHLLEELAREGDQSLLAEVSTHAIAFLVRICRFLGLPGGPSWAKLKSEADFLRESIESKRVWWSSETQLHFASMFDATNEALGFLGVHSPKLESLMDWVFDHPDGSVLAGERERAFLKELKSPPEISWAERSRTREILSEVVVPAWYGRQRMERLLCPPIAREVTLLLYRPEERWHLGLSRAVEVDRAAIYSLMNERGPFRSLGVTPARDLPMEREVHLSLPDPDDVVLRGRRALVERQLESSGDRMLAARLFFFSGGSWAAFTPEHRVLQLVSSSQGGEGTLGRLVQRIASELSAGDLLLLVRGSDRDAIRDTVDKIAPKGLRDQAAEWRRAIDRYVRSGHSFSELQEALRREDCSRTQETLRRWVLDDSTIGPRNGEVDVDAILEVTQDVDLAANLDRCKRAIETLWRLHQQCGAQLTQEVVQRASGYLEKGTLPDELLEIEERIVLVAIETVDPEPMLVPPNTANRLNLDVWPG